MATQEEREQFLREHRFGILATMKKDGAPQLTPVYYAWQDGEIVISTTRSRMKAHNVKRDPRVSFCAIEEQPNFRYQTVYGRATVTEDDAVDVMMIVGGKMAGRPIDESQRPAVEERARSEGRVVIHITPDSYSP